MKPWFLALVLLVVGCAATHSAPLTVQPVGNTSQPPPSVGGLGELEARRPNGDSAAIRLKKVLVSATQIGDMAEVSIVHAFMNDTTDPLEGTFRFPMPDGAIMTGLAMMINGNMMEGELVDNEVARRTYESIVDSMRDPALLEWERGTTFKMRVFPIEPKSEKVVEVRYLCPLHERKGRPWFVQGTAFSKGSLAPETLQLRWEGREITPPANWTQGSPLEVAAKPITNSMQEVHTDATYSAVRFRPQLPSLGTVTKTPTNWLVVVDSSRSVLEEKTLQLRTLRHVLNALPRTHRFRLATLDLDLRLHGEQFDRIGPDTIESAVTFAEKQESDGATDFGAFLTQVGKLAAATSDLGVLYLGDAEASWGVTDSRSLRLLAREHLPKTPLYLALQGPSVDLALAEELASETGGRVVRVRREQDLSVLERAIVNPPKQLVDLEVLQPKGSVALPAGKFSLVDGQDKMVLVRTPKGQPVPKHLTIRGRLGTRIVENKLQLSSVQTRGIARRFGAEWISLLEHQRKPKEEIVLASTAFGVMSKHTSFLVLESEEAYQRHQFERRAASKAHVQGVDLLTSNIEITLDRIQPGDPEILIEAPPNAVQVVVTFPWGESKIAVWDPEARSGQGAWVVRFLVDLDTPEGSHEAQIMIQHADGRSEIRSVQYVVDLTPPKLDVRFVKLTKGAGWKVIVTQQGDPKALDLKRVEAVTEDGQHLRFKAVKWGEFHSTLRTASRIKLRVVGFDVSFNQSAIEVTSP